MSIKRYVIVEQTNDVEYEIAMCANVEDAERLVAALRYFRNGGGISGDEMAPHIDTDWEIR